MPENKKINILVNYLYELYPFTTASYFDMCISRRDDLNLFHADNYKPEDIDIVLNVEPVHNIINIPGIPCLYYEIDNHVILGNDKHWYDQADLILLAQGRFLPYYNDYKTAVVPLACYPLLHKRYKEEKQIYDIGFIGNDTYPHRKKMLNILNQNFKLLKTTADPGEPYSRLFNQCKMIFNCQMTGDVNMRFFEAISCGRLLVTDYLPEQDQFAVRGRHYVTYEDSRHLVDVVKFYLDDAIAREEIAHCGMKHIQEKHNYNNRLNQIICLAKTLKF